MAKAKYIETKRAIDRLAQACRVAVRQWDSGHPIGHDAILELHRALKQTTPELKRPNLDALENASAETKV